MSDPQDSRYDGSEIAIVGMACRLPGATTIEELWRNLVGGVESLTVLTDEELLAAGVDPALILDPRYVRRASLVDDVEWFDPAFFGYTPLEAKLMDPQHRLFLECAWEVFEQAGYDPEVYPGRVGVFTGAKTNTYLLSLFSNREFFRTLDSFQIALGNDLAAMATRVSYKFNLRGPSYALHTACSTSLVAVHLACQSLLLDECRMAVAGGAAVNIPYRRGYAYQKGGILSPDGSCRTFDEQAQGSNFGNGAGAVLLKRLEDAIADGDHVYAIIRGSATNNDGSLKASYTAPGVEGQTDVLIEAMAAAGVDADSISYVEAHGTATDLGDSIEMLALTEAFRASTSRRGFCAVGSIKTNIGHLETAAGVAGLIKTAMALERKVLPPSLHFTRANPKIDFESSPFYVNASLREWEAGDGPRRAGISSFGIGSTNAHVILEEPPEPVEVSPSRPWQLLVLSARTETALGRMTANLAERLRGLTDADLPDVAYTLQVGRRTFPWRRAVVCRGVEDAVAALEGHEPERVFTHHHTAGRPAAFLFPGLGDHHVDMGLGLYRSERVFRETVDRCAEVLRLVLGMDLREVMYPSPPAPLSQPPSQPPGEGEVDLRAMLRRGQPQEDEASRRLNETWLAQPALFVVEYALARLWMTWGIRPQAMIGYSLGEYVAACLAGVLSLEDALVLVAKRARMIQDLEAGAMLAVTLPEAELAPRLAARGLSLAAVNGPNVCVAAGPVEAVEALERELAGEGVVSRRLPTTHAFHSAMMERLAGPLTELVRTFKLKAPEVPYVSNVSGAWITPEQATDPGYWARHMVQPVRFAEGAAALLRERDRILLEVGPGLGLSSFLKQHPDCNAETASLTFPSMRAAYGRQADLELLLATLGRLWLVGAPIDWKAFWAEERRRRMPLPTYPFERQRYWVDPVFDGPAVPAARRVTLDKQPDMADWFYRPVWKKAPLPEGTPQGSWLVFCDPEGLGDALAARLRDAGCDVTRVLSGAAFADTGSDTYEIDPAKPADYDALLATVRRPFSGVVHLWSASPVGPGEPFEAIQDRGFYSLLFLAQALGKHGMPARIEVVTSQVQRVTGGEALVPEKATLIGPCRVIPQELPRVTCRVIDVELPFEADRLVVELAAPSDDPMIAWRGGERFVQSFEREPLPEASGTPALLRERGVYLITGGLGGLGLAVAEYLARTVQARLVLTGRSPVGSRGAQLQAIEEAGGEVMAVSADVTDLERMREVIAEARSRFGALHGMIHMAGTPGGGIIQLKTREAAARILAPKVEGARVLGALVGEDLDFLVIFSSIASVLGEFGQADYCGANAFLDAFAQRNAARGHAPTVTIDWDIWREVGLAVHTEVPEHLRPWRQEMLEQALWPREGVEALGRVLDRALGRVPQIVVSAQDLPGRIELGKAFTGESFLAELEKLEKAPARPARRVLGTAHAAAADGSLERRVAEVWQRVLGIDEIGLHDNFFDLGGNSLLGLQLVSELGRDLDVQIAPVTLFESPTVSALTRHLRPEPEVEESGAPDEKTELAERRRRLRQGGGRPPIAIVGMAGRFPGARDVDELWENLRNGVESVTFFTDEELAASGVSPEVFNDPRYVRAGAILEDMDRFDAGLFGYSPREAEVMDPQHRIFLEHAWEVLEKAGYDPQTYPGAIGVFAGSNLSTYLLRLYGDPEVKASVNMLQAILGNDKDSLTTTVSYKLNLRGPSVAVQTFCSTSLVAVHMACQSLRNGECDMALAGGIRVVTPERQGYLYEQGGIAPSDGHSHSFDAKANGSVLGHGVGIVCLKRLDDALADGDPIQAVILGSAVNNDGSLKAGYTAPSVAGQAEAVAAAYEDAGIDPATLGYVEAHGSATELGDPIEVAALTKAFRTRTDKRQYCPIGSVKANFGHLDRAAGVTGLIKTVLSLRHGEIPPNILFDEPNPKIDFEGSPFFVNTELREWKSEGAPRRAAVNSLGMGGTNVHVVVEEAPHVEPSGPSRPWQLLLLSARTDTALDTATANLAGFLEAHPETELADAAFTLQVGRTALEHRRAVVCRDLEDAVSVLRGGDPRRVMTAYREEGERPVVFLFSGMGGQYPGMGRGLYEAEPVFREEVDRCAEILKPVLGADLREVMYPSPVVEGVGPEVDLRKMLRRSGPQEDEAARRLNQTRFAHPALFVLEYSLAQLWMEWGIRPQAMIGYSLGEYVAACLAGVFSLEDALALVAERARLIEELPAGAMLAVGLPEDEASSLLDGELSVAAVNGPEQTVVAGPLAVMDALEMDLTARGIACRRLQTTHAFHSRMVEPLSEVWAERVGQVSLQPPRIPYISNATGTWVTPGEATDPAFWARHTCQTVRFSEGIAELLREPGRVLLEIGPGPALSSLVLQHPAGREAVVVGSLRHSYETQPDVAYALAALGRLWLTGVRIDWAGFYARERRLRVELPTYPFERKRYWIDTVDGTQPGRRLTAAGEEGTYLYLPAWRRAPLASSSSPSGRWLIFANAADDEGIGDALTARLRGTGLTVSVVRPGAAGEPFTALGEGTFRFDPRSAEGHAALLDALGGVPDRIVYLWALGVEEGREVLALGFESLLAFAGALVGRSASRPVRIWVVGDELHDVTGDETPLPERAAVLGACRAIPAELPHVVCNAVDVTLPGGEARRGRLLGQLLAELGAETPDRLVALRGQYRWVAAVEPAAPAPGESSAVHVVELGQPLAQAAEILRTLTSSSSGLLVVPEAPGAEAAALGFLADAFAAGSEGRWTSVAWGLGEASPEAVSRLLSGGLAPQAVASPLPLPERWSRLDGFPRTERGARSTVGSYPRPTLRVEYVAPRSDVEERIAGLWQELLGVAQVGIHDNFLDLGGDSLLATRLAARMRETFHLDLPVRLFFEKSTVAELGEAVAALDRERQERQTLDLLEKIQELSEEELEMEILRMESLAEQGR